MSRTKEARKIRDASARVTLDIPVEFFNHDADTLKNKSDVRQAVIEMVIAELRSNREDFAKYLKVKDIKRGPVRLAK
jgi:hypothetical protein